MPSAHGSKRRWFPGREYLKEFLEFCRQANLQGKESLIEKVEQTLSGDSPDQGQSDDQRKNDAESQAGQVTPEP